MSDATVETAETGAVEGGAAADAAAVALCPALAVPPVRAAAGGRLAVSEAVCSRRLRGDSIAARAAAGEGRGK